MENRKLEIQMLPGKHDPELIKKQLAKKLRLGQDEIELDLEKNQLKVPLKSTSRRHMERCADFANEHDLEIDTKEDEEDLDKKWKRNMLRDEQGNIAVKWNHQVTKFDKALEKIIAEGKLDPSQGHQATGLRLFQLDNGASKHPRVCSYPGYNMELAANFFKPGKEDRYDDYRGFPQGPGHSTSTAFTVIGPRGKEEDFKTEGANHKRLSQELNEGLFPYVDFIPLKISRSVLLTRKTKKSMYKAVKYAVDHGADVLSMSMAGFGWSYYYYLAAQYAFSRGVIFVCASGSEVDFISDVMKPASLKRTVGVGGISTREKDGEYQLIPLPRGNDGKSLDISAPARWIYTAGSDKDGHYHRLGIGTSQSAAHVASAAALWKHYWKEELENFQPRHKIVQAFKWALRESMDVPKHWSEREKRESRGILNVLRLLDFDPRDFPGAGYFKG